MSLLHSSTRRPPALQASDYDHEIVLEDHTKASSLAASRSRSADGTRRTPDSDQSSRRHSDAPFLKTQSPLHLRQEMTRRKYKRYQNREPQVSGTSVVENEDGEQENVVDSESIGGQVEARGRTKARTEPESAIDILYENQRGGFLCGMPLFSSKALGNADPAPWTNIALKTSATDITNAQVPDPSWDWAWKEWSVNHTDEVDQEGWEYSFMFSKKFSWHGPTWWNSFVRRRAWLRKRVKRDATYAANNAHMLTPDYFTIHSAHVRSRSQDSSVGGSLAKHYSLASLSKHVIEEELDLQDICDIGALMKALKLSRIDREKTESVESFIQHGGDDLYYLREHMHDIMAMFIFQASRRSLLAHLLRIMNETTEQLKDNIDDEEDSKLSRKKRLQYLEAAVKCAEEEVRKLEFWSDVKEITEKGLSKGAVDASQGWSEEWAGLDDSGPRDVITEKELPGKEDCTDGEENGTVQNGVELGKGKQKSQEQ